MRIVASQVALTAATSVTRTTSESAQGRLWIGDDHPADPVRVSNQARATAIAQSNGSLPTPPASGNTAKAPSGTTSGVNVGKKAEGVDDVSGDEELLGSPDGVKLLVMRRLLEAMTGKQVKIIRAKDLQGTEDSSISSAVPSNQTRTNDSAQETPQASKSAGWGMQLDIERTNIETKSSDFSATGSIITADGKTIDFTASFSQQSTSIQVEKLSLRAGDAQLKDPLVMLFSGNQAELMQKAQSFDLKADGTAVQLPGIANGAYIVHDKNGNGKVDDGNELLGALSGNGFADLRALDEDQNGFIDSGDGSFKQLYLWDPGHNDGSHLQSLAEANLGALYTGDVATPVELQAKNGDLQGRIKSTGVYVTEDGIIRPLQQIDVKV